VIPSSVTMKGPMRTFSATTAARLQRRMEEVHRTVAFLLVDSIIGDIYLSSMATLRKRALRPLLLN
jgi:hypothetical protein